jgi:hypothetical protein
VGVGGLKHASGTAQNRTGGTNVARKHSEPILMDNVMLHGCVISGDLAVSYGDHAVGNSHNGALWMTS